MTAKEKAKELRDRFYLATLNMENLDAKQCTLICVEEMDKELGYTFLYGDKRRVFYREVKQEIEKL